jgi:hypothetical protein
LGKIVKRRYKNMDPVTIGAILTASSVALPLLARWLTGEGVSEVQPRYVWETPVGQELLRRVLEYQPGVYTGALQVPITPTETTLAQALAQPLNLLAGQQYISDVLAGRYLRPEQQPYLQAMAQEIQRQAGELVRQAGDVVRSQTARAGIPGGSVEQQMMRQATENIARQVAGQLASLYGGIYQQERGLQQQMVPYYLQYALAPTQQAMTGLQAQQYLRQAMLQNILLPYQEFQRREQAGLVPLQYLYGLATAQPRYPQYRLPEWYYYIMPLSQTLSTAGGYMMGSGMGGTGAGGTGGA